MTIAADETAIHINNVLDMAMPWSWVRISVTDENICSVDWISEQKSRSIASTQSRILQRARTQVGNYLHDPSVCFDLPLVLHGTPFQQRVWQELRCIPAGEVLTYGTLARRLKSSARAVGGACRANPIPLIVPCHRVISQSGLGGYSGDIDGVNADIKRALLRHEGVRL